MRIYAGTDIPTKFATPPDPVLAAEYPNEAKFQTAMTAKRGWFQADGPWEIFHAKLSHHASPGFPDLTFANAEAGMHFYAELKAEDGTVSASQRRWLLALAACNQVVFLWRPLDIPQIMDIVQHAIEIHMGQHPRGSFPPSSF